MKVVFGLSVLYNLYYYGSKCLNKRKSDNRNENIIIDVKDGPRAASHAEDRQLAMMEKPE